MWLRVLVATTIAGFALSVWLYLDNRDLRAQLEAVPAAGSDALPEAVAVAKPDAPAAARSATRRDAPATRSGSTPAPALPPEHEETRGERRQRKMAEFSAQFGRLPGETDEQYRERVMPAVQAALIVPRTKVAEMRREAEEKAHVTEAQSKQLDAAFDKVYDNVLDMTNKAIADGQLSPYERNVAGWLTYAGGLGAVLDDANGSIGKILSPDQMAAMSGTGFEWGEYLGLETPWEKITPPPPPPKQ